MCDCIKINKKSFFLILQCWKRVIFCFLLRVLSLGLRLTWLRRLVGWLVHHGIHSMILLIELRVLQSLLLKLLIINMWLLLKLGIRLNALNVILELLWVLGHVSLLLYHFMLLIVKMRVVLRLSFHLISQMTSLWPVRMVVTVSFFILCRLAIHATVIVIIIIILVKSSFLESVDLIS